MNLSLFWNKRAKGLPGALYSFIPHAFIGLLNKFSSLLQSQNLGSVGRNCIIKYNVVIRYPNNIILKDNIKIQKNVKITSELPNATLNINTNVIIAENACLDYTGNLNIGKECFISEGVSIITHHHGSNPKNPPQPKSLNIQEHVWIGVNSTILHNVNYIGRNSIVGAGSVVTTDIPDNVIVAGNPAKVIKKLI